MPYAQEHYPFENKKRFEEIFLQILFMRTRPDTRLVYTLVVLGTALFDTLVTNGFVLAVDGKKMSKRLKNYPDPNDSDEKYGADTVRLYVRRPAVRGEDL